MIGDAGVTQLHEAIADTSGITEIEGVPTSAPEGTPSYNPDTSMLEPSSDNDASFEENRETEGRYPRRSRMPPRNLDDYVLSVTVGEAKPPRTAASKA